MVTHYKTCRFHLLYQSNPTAASTLLVLERNWTTVTFRTVMWIPPRSKLTPCPRHLLPRPCPWQCMSSKRSTTWPPTKTMKTKTCPLWHWMICRPANALPYWTSKKSRMLNSAVITHPHHLLLWRNTTNRSYTTMQMHCYERRILTPYHPLTCSPSRRRCHPCTRPIFH